jgi:hypothetical protein
MGWYQVAPTERRQRSGRPSRFAVSASSLDAGRIAPRTTSALFAWAMVGWRPMSSAWAKAIAPTTAMSNSALRRARAQSEITSGKTRSAGSHKCCCRESPRPIRLIANAAICVDEGDSDAVARIPMATNRTTLAYAKRTAANSVYRVLSHKVTIGSQRTSANTKPWTSAMAGCRRNMAPSANAITISVAALIAPMTRSSTVSPCARIAATGATKRS